MNWKVWTPLALAIVLGLVAAKIGRNMIRHKDQPLSTQTWVQVVVARQSLAPGQELHPQDLATIDLAGTHVPNGMFAVPADLIGRVLSAPLAQNQPVLESLLAPVGTNAGLQALVPAGMRTITIEVNEYSGLAGLLIPGCHVDVIATLQGDGKQEAISRTVVQNVRVTAVGPYLGNQASEDHNQLFKSVTLFVSPAQAEAIELACATGRPRLVLRGSRDSRPAETSGATLAQLRGTPEPLPAFAAVSTPVPAPVSPAPQTGPSVPAPAAVCRTIQVLRGGVESRVSFSVPAAAASAPGAEVFSNVSLESVLPAERGGQ